MLMMMVMLTRKCITKSCHINRISACFSLLLRMIYSACQSIIKMDKRCITTSSENSMETHDANDVNSKLLRTIAADVMLKIGKISTEAWMPSHTIRIMIVKRRFSREWKKNENSKTFQFFFFSFFSSLLLWTIWIGLTSTKSIKNRFKKLETYSFNVKQTMNDVDNDDIVFSVWIYR